jgi:GTP-binding protein
LAKLPPPAPLIAAEEEKVTVYAPEQLTVKREDGVFIVKSPEIERRVAMTYLDNDEAVCRLQVYLEQKGLEAALRQAGVYHGASVRIGKFEFEYQEQGSDDI